MSEPMETENQAVIRTYGNTNLPEGTPDRPLVTFAVFAYNQEKYIREAVEGAFSQTYSPLEIILSDDCSSDRTFEIMEEMAKAYRGPHLVRVRREGINKGTLAHILRVSREAAGVFLVVAAGDDISLPRRTTVLVEAMVSASPDIVVASSDDLIFDETGSVFDTTHDVILRRKWFSEQKAWFHGATACFRTEVLRLLPIPLERILFEDMALIEVFSRTGKKSMRIEEVLIRRRSHDQNVGPIRKLEGADIWVIEKRRLCYARSLMHAYMYAADALARFGVNNKKTRKLAEFLGGYARWHELGILSRLRLFFRSPKYGYSRSLLIRVWGRTVFLVIKAFQQKLGLAHGQ